MDDKLPEPTPEHELKPQIVWLGKFLGLDIYMDIQSVKDQRKVDLARRVFKKMTKDSN